MSLPVVVGCLSHYSVKGRIERLSVGKTNHCADAFYGHVGISLVGELMHGLLYSVFVYEAREICAEFNLQMQQNSD